MSINTLHKGDGDDDDDNNNSSTLIVLAATQRRCMNNTICCIYIELLPDDEQLLYSKHVEENFWGASSRLCWFNSKEFLCITQWSRTQL